ncbi:hypothetical protein BGZ72_010860 [Mortierella alpina]|nr:hypothetical protein BGZ72_010860 [Mortierella alpina]
MPTYFVPFQYTGVIGIISAILGGLYTYGISLLLNFAIQHSNQSDLRLRIASTYGIIGLVKEIANSGKQPHHNKASILFTILLFTLAGKSLSFLVTTGIKASTGIQLGALETVETRLGSSTLELSSRGDSLSVLQSIYDFQTSYVGKTVNFEVLANSIPSRVAEVEMSNDGGRFNSFAPAIPGTFSFVRQMYRFSTNTASCEPMSRCRLRMANTTISELSSPAQMLDAPFEIMYMDSKGDEKSFGELPPVRVGAQVSIKQNSEYLAERPYTEIKSYTEVDGTSVYAAVTTASFQTSLPKSSQRFVNVAQQLIGSKNQHYPAIFDALNASFPTEPDFNLSPRAMLVFNRPTVHNDNLTHVICVGHQGRFYDTNHNPVGPENMISCRETRITVMANKAFKARVEPEDSGSNPPAQEEPDFDDPKLGYQENLRFPYGTYTLLATIYNTLSPTLVTLEEIIKGNMTIDSLDVIDQTMPALLKDIADRVAPMNSEFMAKVVPYKSVPGILFELWAIIFIAIVVLIVVVLFALDRLMNDAVSRASVTTLIEHSTAQEKLPAKGKKANWEETDYSSWALVKDGDNYQVTLRREHIGVRSDETKNLRYD